MDSLRNFIVVCLWASITDDSRVVGLSFLVTLEGHSVEVGPGKVVAKLSTADMLLDHLLLDIGVNHEDCVLKTNFNRMELGSHEV